MGNKVSSRMRRFYHLRSKKAWVTRRNAQKQKSASTPATAPLEVRELLKLVNTSEQVSRSWSSSRISDRDLKKWSTHRNRDLALLRQYMRRWPKLETHEVLNQLIEKGMIRV